MIVTVDSNISEMSGTQNSIVNGSVNFSQIVNMTILEKISLVRVLYDNQDNNFNEEWLF